MVIVILLLIAFFIFRFKSKYKSIKLGSLSLFTGGVKCGKSTTSMHFVFKEHKKAVFKVRFKNFFYKLFDKPLLDIPLIYSNIPLSVPYVPITHDLLMRKTRFVYGSIIYINEASLVADSQLIQDKQLNTQLLLFAKLIGHETLGGKMIIDTQSISDVHYAFKRSFSTYFYIHHLITWIPFILVAKVQEMHYSEDGSIIQVSTEDVENTLKTVIFSKSVWKKFDAFCYSSLTDNLDVEKNILKNNKDLKARRIVSFRPSLNVGVQNEKKNN